jgi:hypothetical protein
MVEWLGLEPCCSRFEFLITLITTATMMVSLIRIGRVPGLPRLSEAKLERIVPAD